MWKRPPCIRVWPVSAVYWGLRSPNSSTENAYYVSTSGALNNNNVSNPNFAARPALMGSLAKGPARPPGKEDDRVLVAER